MPISNLLQNGCCCGGGGTGCGVSISLYEPPLCVTPSIGYGNWDARNIFNIAQMDLTAVVTGPSGVVTNFSNVPPGAYTITVSEVPQLCYSVFTCRDGFGNPGVLPNPCIYYGSPVTYGFTVVCPGTNTFSFAGPPITSFTMLVQFNFNSSLCAPPLTNYSYTITLNTGETVTCNFTLFSSSFDCGTCDITFLLTGDITTMTVGGTATLTIVGPTTSTFTHSFSLNFCDGPFQSVALGCP
jgi:hypothetical protein